MTCFTNTAISRLIVGAAFSTVFVAAQSQTPHTPSTQTPPTTTAPTPPESSGRPSNILGVTPPNPPDRGKSKAWAYPVVANGRLYIRDAEVLWCYDVKAEK